MRLLATTKFNSLIQEQLVDSRTTDISELTGIIAFEKVFAYIKLTSGPGI